MDSGRLLLKCSTLVKWSTGNTALIQKRCTWDKKAPKACDHLRGRCKINMQEHKMCKTETAEG